MMLGKLLTEIRRRHLWPIAVAALLVAIAAPLLFLKSAPPDAPVASAVAPAPAAAGQLPARARRLLATSDADDSPAPRRARKASDPFQPPSSSGPAASATEKKAPKEPTTATPMDPVPVVITNADGTTPQTPTAPQASTAPITGDGTTPASSGATSAQAAVDVRFGERLPARLYRRIPRLQTFVAGGRVIAIFVKYSPRRDKAVFAIAPTTLVTGDVECRRKQGVCRYVDVPAGKHVRLTTLASDGSLVSRRLDVARIDRTPVSSGDAVAAAITAPADGSCLLGKLLALTSDDPPLARDACN